ncbi:TetR family transcriptional regulator [Bacteriovorax stolpii]|nr:TetR family transcriptional regulator [Bacteriovorax stolpii]
MKKTKENGRDRLIASALKLFSEKSFHAVSVREICDDAHANPSLISFHFGGKDSLLEVIFEEELLSSSFQDMVNILTTPTSIIDMEVKLSLYLQSYVNFYLENKEVVSIYLEELEKGHDLARRILSQTYGKIWDRLHLFIQEAQSQNFIKPDWDSKIVCFQIISPFFCLIRSRSTNLRRAECTLDDGEFTKKLIKQIVCSIKE